MDFDEFNPYDFDAEIEVQNTFFNPNDSYNKKLTSTNKAPNKNFYLLLMIEYDSYHQGLFVQENIHRKTHY